MNEHHHCRQLFDQMSAYLDGELDAGKAREIKKHLDECECCKSCLDSVRQVRDLLRTKPAAKIPSDLKNRLKDCLKQCSE